MTADVGTVLASAVQSHQSGNLREAEEGYTRVLGADPDNADALHLLGLVKAAAGEHAEAATRIARAVELHPEVAAFHYNLGTVLEALDDFNAAEAAYRRAIRRAPEHMEAQFNLGNILRRHGRLDEAVACFRRAIEIDAEHVKPHLHLADTLAQQGATDAAAESYRRALDLAPEDADAHFGLAGIARDAGDLSAAARHLRRGIAAEGSHVEAVRLGECGHVLIRLGEMREAAAVLAHAVERSPDEPGYLVNLGYALIEVGDLETAVTALRHALEIDPESIDALNNLAKALRSMGETAEAIECYRRVALRGDPDLAAKARHMVACLTGETTAAAPDAYVRDLFDYYAPKFDSHLAGRLGYDIPALLRRIMARYLPASGRFADAIDLGCGTGMAGEQFRRLVGSMVGVDLSPRMVELARSKDVYDTLEVGDAVGILQSTTRRFDLFIATDMVVYVGDLTSLFQAVTDHAKPGFRFAFSTERNDGAGYVLRGSGRYAHGRTYIEELSARFGLTVLHCEAARIRKEEEAWIMGDVFVLSDRAIEP